MTFGPEHCSGLASAIVTAQPTRRAQRRLGGAQRIERGRHGRDAKQHVVVNGMKGFVVLELHGIEYHALLLIDQLGRLE